MSKICSICGFECSDTALSCPTCGTPFHNYAGSAPTQPVTEAIPSPTVSLVQSQTVPVQPQTMPVQPQPSPVQPPLNAIQPQATGQFRSDIPLQPQPVIPPQPAAYIQNPGMAGQVTMGMAEAPKKSTKTLWIVLGIVGGVILLLLLFALVLFLVLHKAGYSLGNHGGTPNNLGNRSTDYHEYYYADYNDPSFHSEAFADVTTEAPTTETATTEAPVPSGYLNDAEAFRQEDLTLHTVEEDLSVTPATVTFLPDHGYMITETGEALQIGSGTFNTPDGFQGKQAALGRNITRDCFIDELVAVYGIDSTNAIWQMSVNDTYEYYYYSTTTKPDLTLYDYSSLIFGWYRNGDTWNRLLPQDIFDFWQNGTVPECEEMILYLAVSDNDYSLRSVSITYGTADYFQEFIVNWQTLSEIIKNTSEE